MKVEIKLSVTIRSKDDVDWITISLTDNDLINMAKIKAIECSDKIYTIAECDEVDNVIISD
jgi:hypothetical protein